MNGKHWSRRGLLRGMALAGGAVAIIPRRMSASESSPLDAIEARMTATQEAGPFYPVVKPLDRDADLTRVEGAAGRAEGQVIEVTGRIINLDGRPVEHARMEIWQANAHGRYAHDSDPNLDAPLDPNFQGYALIEADDEGQYRFRSIKPAAYPVPASVNSAGFRPPHIHVEITGRRDRLTTQLYFPGERLNDTDSLLATARAQRNSLIARVLDRAEDMDEASQHLRWDVVLVSG